MTAASPDVLNGAAVERLLEQAVPLKLEILRVNIAYLQLLQRAAAEHPDDAMILFGLTRQETDQLSRLTDEHIRALASPDVLQMRPRRHVGLLGETSLRMFISETERG